MIIRAHSLWKNHAEVYVRSALRLCIFCWRTMCVTWSDTM